MNHKYKKFIFNLRIVPILYCCLTLLNIKNIYSQQLHPLKINIVLNENGGSCLIDLKGGLVTQFTLQKKGFTPNNNNNQHLICKKKNYYH